MPGFHGVGVPKATKMKNPRRFSRLVDLRPVEPSRGPSLVKVNTISRQCISVRAPTSLDPPVHSTLFTRPSNSPSFSVAPAESRQRSLLPFYLSFFSSAQRRHAHHTSHPRSHQRVSPLPRLRIHRIHEPRSIFSSTPSGESRGINIRLTNAPPWPLKSVFDVRSFPSCCRYPSSRPRNRIYSSGLASDVNITIGRERRDWCQSPFTRR